MRPQTHADRVRSKASCICRRSPVKILGEACNKIKTYRYNKYYPSCVMLLSSSLHSMLPHYLLCAPVSWMAVNSRARLPKQTHAYQVYLIEVHLHSSTVLHQVRTRSPVKTRLTTGLQTILNGSIQHDFVRARAKGEYLDGFVLSAGNLFPHAFPQRKNL